ncbi:MULTISPECIES: ectonucleotide pyrophosphatase/phosphodiesterase [Gammaproteobacteria]|uniref:alkaline phosphatase family protein n=1 Tax=Gammaproteobacteria TaxID=1236 RepID=UPI000DD05038|nr:MULTISPECIES: ectonucleotide pyrophosphatase/phosphodiesterase [Gammaproteobacteria]RTE86931.1 alkaline phosphatase family protein [Aliidiomarina sp. B3213]TCZ93279.1 alkaline phosphatase family protein [Lysobacter sp. N42]
MRNWMFIALFAITLLSISGCAEQNEANEPQQLTPTLILISIDGMRHDYIDMYQPDNIQALAQHGVRVGMLEPVFPSKTFPNHFALVTGLHAENHGIIGNNIYDPEYQEVFGLSIKEANQNSRWWQGEPIWITAERQGVTSATYFFPGSEAEINNHRPTYWHEYDGSVSNRDRVEGVLDWLRLPAEERPQFLGLYFSDVDSAGHGFGPESAEVAQAIEHVDGEIGYLMHELEAMGIADEVNIMISSDHGMYEVNLEKHVVVDTAFDQSLAEYVTFTREIIGIHPLPGQTEAIYQQLQENIPPSAATVYYKRDIPERFHYQANARIPEIFILAQPGYALLKQQWLEDALANGKYGQPMGSHGYDNAIPEMQGILVAAGPQFKSGERIAHLRMVDVYNVMSTVLGILPAPNDGDPNVIPLMINERSLSE